MSLGALNACTRTGSAATGTSRALDRWLIGVVRSPRCATARLTLAERSPVEVNAAGVAAGALSTFMAQRILANWRKYPKPMSVVFGPSSVEEQSQPRHAMKFCGKCSAATRLPWSSTVGVTTG